VVKVFSFEVFAFLGESATKYSSTLHWPKSREECKWRVGEEGPDFEIAPRAVEDADGG
jgi:hypothetical protein